MISAKVTRKEIHDAAKGTAKGVTQAINALAIAIEGKAVLNAPVDTGILRQSITRKVDTDEAVIGSSLSYALYQEEGTRKMEAANSGEGYLKPAVYDVKSRLTAIVGKFIRSEIRRS